MHELGFNSRKINVKVSYYYRDKIYFSATPEMVREYYSKCYSMLPYEKVELYKSVLPIFITTFEELEKKLKANVEIIPEEIISIDMKNNQLITANDVYDYDVLINTIPLPVFCYLAKLNLDYLFI
ncbi:MAG: hypothetical protein QMD12_02915, partial [Candidatus Aenigmarchaeota archaeon]|nr:hypothetical protein [Candidatus Aenigmarchaeota archaeon]